VVVGTCARMLDLATTGSLPFDRCDAAIFDEIDRLMAKETREQLERLVSMAPGDSLKVFVSATIGERTREWIEARCPDAVLCDPGAEGILNDAIEHWAFFEEGRKKVQFLRSFLAAANPDRCLVFFSRSEQAAEAAEKLAHHGLAAAALHSKADQDARKAAIQAFKEGKVKILVTSDLAARGLDFPGVTHVISADLPDDADIYVHRAGRTGRAGALGFSIIAADLVELQRASRIAVKKKFSFHCMELAGGRMRDKDPEAFFVEAEATEVERQMRERERRAFGRVDRGAPGRERPPSGDGSRPRARETGRASAYDTRERPRTARAPSSAAGDTQGPKARDARGRPPVRGPLSADRSSPAGGPPRARGARDHGGPERPRQPRAEGGPPRKHDALPPSKRKGKRRDGRNGE
jgi:superfamily II DNA/RNA helicase